MVPFTPKFIDGDFYSCSPEEMGAHLDEIQEFIDGHKSAVIFVTENETPKLVVMALEEYERLREGEKKIEPKTDLITIPVSTDEKEAIEAFSRSIGMSIDDVLAEFMKVIAQSKSEIIDCFDKGESAIKITERIADKAIGELVEKRQ